MRILIMGGTNFMGPLVVRSLSEQDIVVDTTRIRRELGYKERIDVEEALRRTVAWERANPSKEVDPRDFDYLVEDSFLNARNE